MALIFGCEALVSDLGQAQLRELALLGFGQPPSAALLCFQLACACVGALAVIVERRCVAHPGEAIARAVDPPQLLFACGATWFGLALRCARERGAHLVE